LIAVFSRMCCIIEWMVALLKLMYCFFISTRASSPTSYKRSSFPASCVLRYLVYAICISLCCAVICSQLAVLTPAARAVATYAPGLTGAAYTQTGSAMTMQYFSSGMTHVRYLYRSLLGKMGGLQYGNGPAKFILKGVDGLGSYYSRDLCYGVFLSNEYFVRPILGQF
jgi:hypothetical protein